MQSAKLKHYRELLLDARRQLVREADRVLESIPEEVHPPGEHEIAPSEGIDTEISLEQEDNAQLHEIDAALERVKDGTYGTCRQCGKEIPASRLEAVPFATYCTRCETARERV